jgi:hypothetical protein
MAQNTNAAFEAMMKNALASDERIKMDTGRHPPYFLEPVTPFTETLLDYHTDFLAGIIGEGDKLAAADRETDYLAMMADILNIEQGEEVCVRGMRSFTVEEEIGKGRWTGFPSKLTAFGNFRGLWVGDWFDVPEGISLSRDEAHMYGRTRGLLVALSDPYLLRDDGVVGFLRETHTYVPLNHEKPQMYKVIREQSSL